MTEYMEAVSDPDNPLEFDYVIEEENFDKTFTVLQRTLGEFSFSLARTSRGRDTLIRGFSSNHFEAVTLGIQKRLDELESDNKAQMARLKEVLTRAKLDKRFSDMTTGGGKNSPGQLRDRIQFIEDAVATL